MRAARTDANHAAIVNALRQAGCSVLDLSAVGGGCPDLLVSCRAGASNVLLEVKDGSKPPSARKLTPQQKDFHATWRGPCVVVTSLDQALVAVGMMR